MEHGSAEKIAVLISKIKIKKPVAVDVLFKAFPMVPLSCTVDPIWPDGTFKGSSVSAKEVLIKSVVHLL